MRKLSLLLSLLVLAFLAGCGGDDGEDSAGTPAQADQGADVDQLLEETFSGERRIDSGELDLALGLNANGEEVTVTLSGPFRSEGDGELPSFAMDASLEGGGQSFEAGATSTSDALFVAFQGEDYEVSPEVFADFREGYLQSQEQGADEPQSLAALGLDPRGWLSDARVDGTAEVGGVETTKIVGGVDVPALLDDVDSFLQRARSLGLQGAEDLPSQLTPEQRRQAEEAVRDVSVEIYTGTDDRILRRMVVALGLDLPGAGGQAQPADVRLDFSLLGVNEEQQIEAPADAQPFDQLLEQLGGLGLGGLGGGGAGGAGAGGAGGGASQQDLEAYAQCIEQAGSDSAAARDCAELLAP